MEPITLVTAALIAGHGALEEAGKDAYAGLKSLIRKLFAGDAKAERALDGFEEEPKDYEVMLKGHLDRLAVAKNDEVISLAQRILNAEDPAGSSIGKYRVTVTGGEGVQVGDHNTQTNHFGPR